MMCYDLSSELLGRVAMKKFSLSFLIAMLILPFLFVRSSEALTSNCLKTLHMQAMSDAINITPPELKAILKEREAAMHKQVNTIHATAPNDRQQFSAYYKAVTDEMKSIDAKRLDYVSRMMTHITIYPFLTYSPIKTYESCSENDVLNSVTVLYDGFNSKAASTQYPESYTYKSKQELIKLQQFYSIMVNDISDIWVSMWKEAGKDIAGLPPSETLVRGKIKEVRTVSEKAPELKAPDQQSSSGVITNSDLGKYRNSADGKYVASPNNTDDAASTKKAGKDKLFGSKDSPAPFKVSDTEQRWHEQSKARMESEEFKKEMAENRKKMDAAAYERCEANNTRARSYYAECLSYNRSIKGLQGMPSQSCGKPTYDTCVKPVP